MKKAKTKKPILSEHRVQVQLLGELVFKLKRDVYVGAIPNGGFRRKSEASRLKAEGVRSGAPDLFFVAPQGKTFWLEMKNEKGKLSNEQLGFSAMCERNQHEWAFARSVDEALGIIDAWGLLR